MSENQPETPDANRSSDETLFDASSLRRPVSTDRDDAAARIAELVRRSNERQSGGAAPDDAPSQQQAPATPPAAPAAPTPAAAPAPAQADPQADPHADPQATQAMQPVTGAAAASGPADPQATQAMTPVTGSSGGRPVDPDATHTMAPVSGEATQFVPSVAPSAAWAAASARAAQATQALRPASPPVSPDLPQSSSGAPEVTPVAPLDYDPTAQMAMPAAAASASSAAHTMQFQRPEIPPTPDDYAPASRSEGARPRRSVPSWAIVAGALGVILLAVWAFAGGGSSTPSGTAAGKAGSSAAAGAAAPYGFQVRLSDTITDCAQHSRGKVKASFRGENCVKATRSVGTGTVKGRKVLFVVSRIEMPSPDAAARIKAVLDGDGTGNINDLLREGRRFAGGPRHMPSSGYASVQADEIVGVAEAGYLDGTSADSDPALREAASAVAESVGTH